MSTNTWTSEVARGPSAPARDAPTAQLEHAAGLGAGRQREVLGAVEGLEREVRAEGRLRHRHVEVGDEVLAVARKRSWGRTREWR